MQGGGAPKPTSQKISLLSWWTSTAVREKGDRIHVGQMYIDLKIEKNNKESPLFYNENGLSPLELLKIGEKKYEDIEMSNM